MLPILFQDQRFVVLDKPAGLAVHRGPSGKASVEDWFPQLSRRRNGPWLAHRLDADTSGCLVVALRKAALLEAQNIFASGLAGKVYWAVVRGGPKEDRGLVDLALVKRTTPTGWRMDTDVSGSPAVTAWQVKARGTGAEGTWSWLELRPRTGRTHQIRVHCKELGCPILGDAIYGNGMGTLQLLARSIHLPLSPALQAVASVPAHMTWAGLENS